MREKLYGKEFAEKEFMNNTAQKSYTSVLITNNIDTAYKRDKTS